VTAVRGRPEIQVWELSTGRPVARPVRLSPRDSVSTLPIAITPDGRRACVSFLPAESAVINLEALLRLPSVPTSDLALLAELTTARRIELGDLSGFTTDQWIEHWGRLRERESDVLRSLFNSPLR
jgi:hypothetical protein